MDLDFSSELIEKLLFKRSLADKQWLNILQNIFDKRWFKVQNLSLLFKLLLNYYNKYNTIPSIQVIQALLKKYLEKNTNINVNINDINQLLTEIVNLNINISDDILIKNFKEFIRRNAFYNALYDNAELLERNPSSYDKVVEKCLDNFDKVQKIIFNDVDNGLNYFSDDDLLEHWKFIDNPEAKIKTGWQSIDSFTNGGILRDGRMLMLIMAQAGLGKSVFLSNLAVNLLKQNLSVVVISLEMSENVYAQRFDAHISESNINQLKANKTSALARIKAFRDKYQNAALYIKEYPPRSVKTRDIELYLENLKNNGKKFDVVIVDYLGLVLPNNKSDSMYKDGLAVSEELRALSYKFTVPIISAVQCNTSAMNSEEIDMEHVSESRGIVHTVDALFALYQTDADRENQIINMRILKNRLGGKVGKIANFTLDPESLVLNDITFDNNINHNIKSIEQEFSDLDDKFNSLSSDIDDL